ncbi:MAG: reductive dehalogenase [Bacteroidota bacterium]
MSTGYLDKTFKIKPEFEKFDQEYDIFNRSVWDEKINPKNFYLSYDITNYVPKKSEGFDHWDYALRNASWHLADYFADHQGDANRVEGFTDFFSIQLDGPKSKVKLTSAEETTIKVKRAAKMLGAGLVGVCALDDRWLYASRYDRKNKKSRPLDLPKGMKYAIVIATPMDYELAKTVPSATGGAITGVAYSTSLSSLNALAQFITNLGYQAHASMNDTGLTIPMAIEAGLGEYGRNGLLITKEFGPRIRIGKIFTDLPLMPDKPINFGVKEFCEICRKCADSCPVKAIPQGEPQSEPPNMSSFKHITKWTVNAEKCFKFWVNMNTDCAICIRVCPYNKDYTKWWNRMSLWLAGTPLRRLMLRLDDFLKFGARLKPKAWWGVR